jgi:glycosyltransferase involved in cell wall biosynthesis
MLAKIDTSGTIAVSTAQEIPTRAPAAETQQIRVLIDLKPALDGYAGIPQESRLLYRGLSGLDRLRTEGLIQHGARRLRPALPLRGRRLSDDRKIDRLSRFVVSLYQDPHSNWFEMLQAGFGKLYARHGVRLKSHLGVSLHMTQFDSTLFEDFVWRTFFSRTLNARDKALFQGAQYRVLTDARHSMHAAGLGTLRYSRTATYPVVDTGDFDYFLTQTPFPGRVKPGTTMVVRYHDAVPVLMPHTIQHKAFHQASHFHALKSNVANGAWFSCISEATRADLLKIFPQAEKRTSVIHNMVSDEYSTAASSPDMVEQIVRNRLAPFEDAHLNPSAAVNTKGKSPRYLLMVSTIEPRKNHLLLMQAWERLRYTQHPELKIIFVGNKGWDHAPVLKAFLPWADRGELFWLNNVPSAELRVLYQHAAVTICPGLAEGFDYSGVEAMKCGGLVAASDIPVHREIYKDAAAYFNAYDVEDAAALLHKLLDSPSNLRAETMRAAGAHVSALYSAANIMPQWDTFFSELHAARQSRNSPVQP